MEETFRGTWVVAYRELLRFLQERSRLPSSFAMPLLFLAMLGGGFSRVVGDLAPGVDFVRFMYPGILAMTVLTTSLASGVSVVWDREFGFLREILVAPISRTGIVLGKAVGAAAVALLQALALLLIAPLIGIGLDPALVLKLVPLLAILSLSLSGLGLLLGSRMRSQARGLVTDIGGALAHGSIVAREYGIPAVMGTGIATQRIAGGQSVTIDGDAGTVTLAE